MYLQLNDLFFTSFTFFNTYFEYYFRNKFSILRFIISPKYSVCLKFNQSEVNKEHDIENRNKFHLYDFN